MFQRPISNNKKNKIPPLLPYNAPEFIFEGPFSIKKIKIAFPQGRPTIYLTNLINRNILLFMLEGLISNDKDKKNYNLGKKSSNANKKLLHTTLRNHMRIIFEDMSSWTHLRMYLGMKTTF